MDFKTLINKNITNNKKAKSKWISNESHQYMTTLVNAIKLDQFTLKGKLFFYLLLKKSIKANYNLKKKIIQSPQIKNEIISKPTFLVGPPRSGTTALFNMMASLGNFRAMKRWEMTHLPFHRNAMNDSLAKHASQLEITLATMFDKEHLKYHYAHGSIPDECGYVLNLSGIFPMLQSVCLTETFLESCRSNSMTFAFEIHKMYAQLLQYDSKFPSANWVFKEPYYGNIYHSLHTVYNDANLIFTHRDPIEICVSYANLIFHGRKLFIQNKYNDKKTLFSYWLKQINYILKRWDDLQKNVENNLKLINVSQKKLKEEPNLVIAQILKELDIPHKKKNEQSINRTIKKSKIFTSNDYNFKDFIADKNKEDLKIFDWYYERYDTYLQ